MHSQQRTEGETSARPNKIAPVAEQADANDLKSFVRMDVWVRIPPGALNHVAQLRKRIVGTIQKWQAHIVYV